MAFKFLLTAYIIFMAANLLDNIIIFSIVVIISFGLMVYSVAKLGANNKNFITARNILFVMIALQIAYGVLYNLLVTDIVNNATFRLISDIALLTIDMAYYYYLLKGMQEYFDDEMTKNTSKHARRCWYLILSNILLQIVSRIFVELMNELSMGFILLVNSVASLYLIFVLILAVQSDKLLRSTQDKQ